MKTLYPELEANSHSFLESNSGNNIYFEECGNPTGLAVVFLHGGPGSGCNENHRRYFNPEKYRIIIFDQRGCNRSTPQGSIDSNTTQEILSDMEAIRVQLSISKWLVYGGSWGSTLALLYTEQYPENVSGLILRGSFLARKTDLDWFLKDGVARIFPDYWNDFSQSFSDTQFDNPIKLVSNLVFSEERHQQLKGAIAWATWAGRIVTSNITSEYELEIEDEDKLINETRIEMHYALNHYFISENQILENITKIPDVPVTIIHGRKDLTCLAETSWLLHKAMARSELIILPDAGHLASEEAMIDALIKATDKMANTYCHHE